MTDTIVECLSALVVVIVIAYSIKLILKPNNNQEG